MKKKKHYRVKIYKLLRNILALFILSLISFLFTNYSYLEEPYNFFLNGVTFFIFVFSLYYLYKSIDKIVNLRNKYKGEIVFENTVSQLPNGYYALFDLDLKINYIKHHLDCVIISPSRLYNIKIIYEPGIIKTDKNKNFIFLNETESSAKIIEYKTRFWTEKESLELLFGRNDIEIVDIVVYLKADRVFKDKRNYHIIINNELVNFIEDKEKNVEFTEKEQMRLANILMNYDGNNYKYYN